MTLLVSCTVSNSDAIQENGRIADVNPTNRANRTPLSPSMTPTYIETTVVEPLATPQNTATSTVSTTPTPKPFLTLAPLPTIPMEKRGEVYDELMNNNGGCSLPCWWGFELGKTSVDQVRQLYATFDPLITEQKVNNNISILTITFVDPQIDNGEQVDHIFISSDGIVIEAEIDAESAYYQIESLLQRLGPPSDVWIWTIPEPYQGILPSRFRLYFPERGVLVLYGVGGTRTDETVNICFDRFGGTSLLLWEPDIWDPDRKKDITERAAEGGSAFNLEGHPLNEVTNWDIKQFYRTLSNPDQTECLETPPDFWTMP